MVPSLSHITFIASDLDRAGQFMEDIFDAQLVYDSGERFHSIAKEKFYLIGGVWIAIMEGDPGLEKSYNHIAFQIDDSDYDQYVERITKRGLDILPGRARNIAEGRSIYFYDDDNHLFELHTGTLEERLAYYNRTPAQGRMED